MSPAPLYADWMPEVCGAMARLGAKVVMQSQE